MTEMSQAKIDHFKRVADKARQVEQFIIEEAATMGITLNTAQAAKFAAIVITVYGNNTPPTPVDPDENIGSV